jgi:hypothetical protein
MYNFVQCPFCAGHETISAEAADAIAVLIRGYVHYAEEDNPLTAELSNIRNAILNRRERVSCGVTGHQTPGQCGNCGNEMMPLCPTPQKRKYSNLTHAKPDAAQWRQHPYECACGYWHLSKQTSAEHATKINSAAADAEEFSDIDPLLT